MKITVIDDDEQFVPATLQIRIETRAEATALYSALRDSTMLELVEALRCLAHD